MSIYSGSKFLITGCAIIEKKERKSSLPFRSVSLLTTRKSDDMNFITRFNSAGHSGKFDMEIVIITGKLRIGFRNKFC